MRGLCNPQGSAKLNNTMNTSTGLLVMREKSYNCALLLLLSYPGTINLSKINRKKKIQNFYSMRRARSKALDTSILEFF